MKVENCPKCGGMHFGSYECPFETPPPRMSDAEMARFDEASKHPYECKCDLCKEWWSQMPNEE